MRYVNVSKNKLKEISKLHQKKYRDELGLFIAEGFKCLDDIIENNIEIVEIFSMKEINDYTFDIPVNIVDEAGMKKISSTDSVCEILTVAKKKKTDINNFKKLNYLALFDSVSDPGNLGTIIRSAAAFGVDGIILYGNCTDIYSSKVIRSTAGNLFKIPVIQIDNEEELEKHFSEHIKIATALSKENNISLKECVKIAKRIIMFGSEAKGLNSGLIKLADKNIRLKMKDNVESLNLAVSASVIFYELFV